MSGRLKKYQPYRQDILINTDWGLPEDDLTEEEADERGLTLFRGRWVSSRDRSILSSELRAYRLIRLAALLMIPFGLGIIAVSVPPSSFAPAPLDLVPWFAVAFACLSFLTGFGLWRFWPWSWRLAGPIVFLVLLGVVRMIFLTITDPYARPGVLGFLIISLIAILIFYGILLSRTTRRIFLVGRAPLPRGDL